jgi:hypothetical protein
MEITRLRVLTLKSKAFFFKASPEWTIETLWNEKPVKILDAYYNQEKISFNDEIINLIKEKFDRFFEIEKPGKIDFDFRDVIFGDKESDWALKKTDELLKLIAWYRIKKIPCPKKLLGAYQMSKNKSKTKKDNLNISISKKSLQSKNHGH